jgi:hypothetical protein
MAPTFDVSMQPGSGRFSAESLAHLGVPDPGVTYEIPDLSDYLAANVLNAALDSVSGNASGPREHPQLGLWQNLVRLTDKAIREYEAARENLSEYGEFAFAGRLSPYFLALDHFENSIDAVFRAGLYLEMLRKHAGFDLQPATTSQLAAVKKLRNAIQHTEEKLVDGEIQMGQPTVLTTRATGLELGPVTLAYLDLKCLIEVAHRAIEQIRPAPR